MLTHQSIQDVIQAFQRGEIDRRALFRCAAGLGVSGTALAALMGASVLPSRAAAAAQDDASGLLTTNNEQQGSWIRNFNPLLPENASCRWPTLHGIFEPLAVWNLATAELVPRLATEWAFSDDNLTLTFTLRDGVTWSDGEPFTANDVAFTWNLFKENDALPGNGARVVIDRIDAVEAVDDATVAFTFNEVYTIGLYDVAGQVIVPEHIWKDIADPLTETNENPVGTGPFTEVARFENQIWELHKNPSYWDEGKPMIDGLRLPAFPSNDAINLATINGELDWTANFIPDIEATFVSKDPENFHYWFPPLGNDVMLYLNTTVAPFDNVDVRKAISMALNREQMCDIAMFGYTHPADATGLSDAYESIKDETAAGAEWVSYNVDKANEMLDAAGLTKDGDVRKTADGEAMEYELNVVSGWSDWVQSCDIMARNLADVGIKVTVKPYDQTTWQTRVQDGDFTMSIGWSSGCPTVVNFYRGVMSSITWNEIGTSSSENWHRFKSQEADDLLTKFASTSDEAEQKDIAVQLQQLFADQAPAVPLFPGPQWGEFVTTRFEGFPSEEDPYAVLSTYDNTRGLVLTTVKPKGA
jgi:peptide/nickel transport system substrate-binding protein